MSLLLKCFSALARLGDRQGKLISGFTLVLCSLSSLQSASAQTVLPPAGSPVRFQTSGPQRCASVGDWYTTSNPAGCPVNGGQATTNAPTNRLHRFFISITAADLAVAGGAITITVIDAESNGTDDELNNSVGQLGNLSCANAAGNCDPTRFQLRNQTTGAVLATQVVGFARPGQPTDIGGTDGTNFTFPVSITQPGVYEVTSETGALPIFGDPTVNLNDDDNGFRVQISAPLASDLLVGQFQGSFQQNSGGTVPLSFYFLTGPGATGLRLRNFDLDNSSGGILYVAPPGGTTPPTGTTSGNAIWNGAGTLNTGEDAFSLTPTPPFNDAGTWQIQLGGLTNDNQGVLEANTTTEQLPLFVNPPRRAGNFTITQNTTLQTTIGATVCHPFTVTNLFFTSDIINLTTSGTNPNYTVQFRDASGTNPYTIDSDGDGVIDTGILQPGAAITLTLCVTPNPGAPAVDNTTITGTSFMDREVRAQANNGPPVPQSVVKTTTIGTVPTADLSIRKTVDSVAAAVGQNATFTITLSNAGPATATNVAVTDQIPAGLTFVSATASQGTYDSTTGLWTVGAVPANGTASLQITVTVNTTNPARNTAQVSASDQPDPDSAPGNNVATEDDQASASLNVPNLRLVKRITAVTQGGNPIVFNQFVGDPNDANDTAPGWAEAQFLPVGVPSVSTDVPLSSGDEVEYTIYFLSDGIGPVLAASLCDQVDARSSLIANTNLVRLGAAPPVAGGGLFGPLAPLPAGNVCTNQANPTGSAVFDLGDVPSTPGSNVGFVRFRVRLN